MTTFINERRQKQTALFGFGAIFAAAGASLAAAVGVATQMNLVIVIPAAIVLVAVAGLFIGLAVHSAKTSRASATRRLP